MWLSLKIKPKFPPPDASIYGIIDVKNNDPIGIGIEKERVDNFALITPERVDNSFVESMDPENIIRENKNIPLFIFEYFAQKSISGLIDETLEKTCLFHFNEAHGHGIVSALIIMTKLISLMKNTPMNYWNDFKRRKEAKCCAKRH